MGQLSADSSSKETPYFSNSATHPRPPSPALNNWGTQFSQADNKNANVLSLIIKLIDLPINNNYYLTPVRRKWINLHENLNFIEFFGPMSAGQPHRTTVKSLMLKCYLLGSTQSY